ncbi:MAG: hypothetical protein WKF60_12270 [Ilumatobacter sp.]
MPNLVHRAWVPAVSEQLVGEIAEHVATSSVDVIDRELSYLVNQNRRIHERDCINLNPAANTMNTRAEAMLASGLGSRPSLGYPGDKYEIGLEAIERILGDRRRTGGRGLRRGLRRGADRVASIRPARVLPA